MNEGAFVNFSNWKVGTRLSIGFGEYPRSRVIQCTDTLSIADSTPVFLLG